MEANIAAIEWKVFHCPRIDNLAQSARFRCCHGGFGGHGDHLSNLANRKLHVEAVCGINVQSDARLSVGCKAGRASLETVTPPPMGRRVRRNLPFAPVVEVLVNCVPRFVTVTEADGRTAPELSVTVPASDAVGATWAQTDPLLSITTARRPSLRRALSVPDVLFCSVHVHDVTPSSCCLRSDILRDLNGILTGFCVSYFLDSVKQ